MLWILFINLSRSWVHECWDLEFFLFSLWIWRRVSGWDHVYPKYSQIGLLTLKKYTLKKCAIFCDVYVHSLVKYLICEVPDSCQSVPEYLNRAPCPEILCFFPIHCTIWKIWMLKSDQGIAASPRINHFVRNFTENPIMKSAMFQLA